MTEMPIVIFAICCPVMSVLLAWQAKGRSVGATPLLVFTIVSIVFINVGFTVFFLNYPQEPWAQTAVLSVSWGILLVGLGGLIGAVVLQGPRVWARFVERVEKPSLPYSVALVTTLVLSGIALGYFYLLGYVPLLEALKLLLSSGLKQGLLNTLRVARDVYINPAAPYIPLQGFMEAVRYFGLPIAALWFLHFYRRGIYPYVSLAALGVITLLMLSSGQRWPLMYMLFAVLVYLTWTLPDRKKLWKALKSLTLIAVALGIASTILLARFETEGLSAGQVLVRGVSDFFHRFFFGNVQVPFSSYQFFPSSHGWLYGQSWWQNLTSYLPGPQPSFPVTFYQLVTGDPRGFTAPPDFYTEAYINFGWLGVIAISFVWGFLLSFLQTLFALGEKSLLKTSILATVTVVVGFSALSGICFTLGAIYVGCFVACVIYVQLLIRSSAARGNMKHWRDKVTPTLAP